MSSVTSSLIVPEAAADPVETPCALYLCSVCGWVYDEAQGLPEEDIEPGTPWRQISESFLCPECGIGKDAFEKLED